MPVRASIEVGVWGHPEMRVRERGGRNGALYGRLAAAATPRWLASPHAPGELVAETSGSRGIIVEGE